MGSSRVLKIVALSFWWTEEADQHSGVQSVLEQFALKLGVVFKVAKLVRSYDFWCKGKS